MKTNLIINIFLILIFSKSYAQISGPDSGKSLMFSNVTNFQTRINIPDNTTFDHPNNNISLEAWIFPTQATNGVIFCKIETDNTREYDLFLLSNGTIRFGLFNNLDTPFLTYSTISNPVLMNTWTHIAATYSPASGQARIYINGVLNISNSIGPIMIASTNTNLLIGAYWLSNNNQSRNHFNGQIDEVRLWHSERSQDEIRNNMCQSLVMPQTNLVAYYNFDEANGTIANDISDNNNNGTLQFFPQAQIGNRSFSGAPIGNASTHNYTANYSGVTLQLQSVIAGNMTIQNISGNMAGIHLFRVDAAPSQTGGLTSPVPVYYGTFLAGGTIANYNAQYNYNNTSFRNNDCENSFFLSERDDNSDATWSTLGSTQNTTTNRFTVTNINARKEIILNTFCDVGLPLNFLSFDLIPSATEVTINWSTSHEVNTDYFVVEKSSNGYNFREVEKIESKKSENQNHYTVIDNTAPSAEAYYRIKQVDLDGKFNYSIIKKLTPSNTNATILFPNPSAGKITVISQENTNITIKDIHGRLIQQYEPLSENYNTMRVLNLEHLSSGIYIVELYSESNRIVEKLLIQ